MEPKLSEKIGRNGLLSKDAVRTACRRALADEDMLRGALEQADIVPQLLVIGHLTGDMNLLERASPFIKGGWSFLEAIPDHLRAEIRERLVEALRMRAEHTTPPSVSEISRDEFKRILTAGIGQAAPDDYVDLLREELSLPELDTRSVPWRRDVSDQEKQRCSVLIVGAGLFGLCLGIKLREAGIPFTIVEKNDAVGGTWYENRYPGSGVDIPNHVYSFSFEPKHDWADDFAKQRELWTYLNLCADKYDVRRSIRFSTEVMSSTFDAEKSTWNVRLRTPGGHEEILSSKIFVSAVGQLNRPSIPNIPGLESFEGPMFHTAKWDDKVDLSGKRVAMIGTGASSMQVGPTIVDHVAKLMVFQRSPNWAGENPNYHRVVKPGMKWALDNVPFLSKWYRFLLFWASGDVMHTSIQVDPNWPTPDISLNAANHALRENLIAYIKREIGDRQDLLPKIIPSYPPYGKRMLRDNYWYRMLTRDNVELIDAGADKIEGKEVIDSDGVRHEADVIILATGFQAGRMLWPMDIEGRDGHTIRKSWGEDDPRAYMGMTAPKFPNMFVLYGPNTNLAHGGGLFFYAECQTRYIMQILREMVENGHDTVECKSEPFMQYNDRVDEAHSRMVWTHKGMKNWYRNSKGRVVANSPWRIADYWAMTKKLNPDEYVWG
ncbi:4-hydroxyacetophenone monooxygenase [Tardiphaga sp. OK246]|uniref:flavin-containing monooxygenase n=1 Tax=Tardiphaga sp. OK246 TaxID=1855307 RepID=UPI000B6C4F0F|nr:NAD(P)/FAD-dependent oxidoreductase [Tardiphaga sp. OK246]SNT31781.1 4-hydroxyacetophenone monooxygenase [Tardiphaga sp. OK246]